MLNKLYKNTRRLNKGRNIGLLISVVFILAAITLLVVILELTNTTHIFHKQKATTSTIPAKVSTDSDTEEYTMSGTPSESGQTNNPASGEKTIAPPSSGSELLAPSGNFVSNHHPSLKDTPGSSAEESVCITTPGALCTIVFTMDGVTKTLESKQVDDSGTVIWQWDVKTAGFVAGTWQVTATATLNGQTKSTTDLQPLEVQP